MKELISEFFELTSEKEKSLYSHFCNKHKKSIFSTIKKDKSLSFYESYVLYLIVKLYDVHIVSELGVRYGISSRIWLSYLPKDGHLYGYDKKNLYNKRLKTMNNSKFTFIKGELPNTYKFRKEDVIFYDVHPYHITRDIATITKDKVNIHCFHDVGKKCFNIESANILPQKRTTCSNKHGWWERHIMAEIFTPGILTDNIAYYNGWKSVIIDDMYGIGVVKTE